MNIFKLQLVAAWVKAQDGGYRRRLERASMRFFDGQVTVEELHAAFVAAFGADGRW